MIMDFQELLNQIRTNLFNLAKETFADYAAEGQKDVVHFLKATGEKLQRWTEMLKAKEITSDEYQWLVASQKDLLSLQGLYQAGVSKILLNKFKNAVIETLVNTVLKWLV